MAPPGPERSSQRAAAARGRSGSTWVQTAQARAGERPGRPERGKRSERPWLPGSRTRAGATTARLQRLVGVSGPFASFQVRIPRRMGKRKGLREGYGASVVGGRTLGSGR